MRCATCATAAVRHRVTMGLTTTTLMDWSSYWDEDGLYHSHNPNTSTTEYTCSNNHRWIERTTVAPCGSCMKKNETFFHLKPDDD